MSEEVITKSRLPITHSTPMKVLCFILAVAFAAVAVISALGVALCINFQFYSNSEADTRESLLGYSAASYTLAWSILRESNDAVDELIEHSNINALVAKVRGEDVFNYTYGTPGEGDKFTRFYGYNGGEGRDLWYEGSNADELENYIELSVWMSPEPTVYDDYYWGDLAIDLGYELRYVMIGTAGGGLLGFIVCLVYLCCAAGRRRSSSEPQPGWGTRVPFDLLTALCGVVICLIWLIILEHIWYTADDWLQFVLLALAGLVTAVLLLGYIMSFALRCKLGSWWRNTLISMLLRFIWRCCKAVGRFCRAFLRRIGIVWKAALAVAILAAIEFFGILSTEYNNGAELFLWILKTIAVLVIVVFLAYMLRDLQRMGAALARGDMSYKVKTEWMPLPLRHHAEHLSSIGQGINRAVEQRMKSERMKTELITNVSHDIKTPLTSIINYADLIGREECDNPKIHEYAAVLHRQSERMKRLIEDLVEASKASTGSIDINLAPCEAGVMLMQVAGEYEQRLEQLGLSLVASQPVHPISIMADGRRLWRVMDNLLNNICKYALPGTRVYLTLEDIGGQAVLSFKNTSRDELNMNPDELLERFVRGEAARHSEGSGLGLSIAKSLTELQGGTLDILCDGDLFKVVLRFPVVR